MFLPLEFGWTCDLLITNGRWQKGDEASTLFTGRFSLELVSSFKELTAMKLVCSEEA